MLLLFQLKQVIHMLSPLKKEAEIELITKIPSISQKNIVLRKKESILCGLLFSHKGQT